MEIVQIGLFAIAVIVVLMIVLAIFKNAHGPRKGRYRTTATGKQ